MGTIALVNSRYELRQIVGRGGMGLVYKAYDCVIGRDVALKTLLDIQGRTALEMFYKEWRILANLHHPNIVEIFDVGEFEDGGVTKPYFVMPLLPGTTLEQLIHAPGQQFAPDRLGEIVTQACRGLQAIHDAGLVHRDIKPSNIFVMDFNSVKLIDFGVAHLVGGNTATGIKGTVSYMAPEQVENQECGPASDVFSLGVVCYETLCGVRPFQGRKTEEVFDAILHQTPAPIFEVNPTISQTVSRAVHKALAKQPRNRYSSALEFADTLQRALRGETIAALDPTRIQPRIQRAIKAFEQANYQMATDILRDLEAAGHIDPALRPLRNQIDQALRRQRLGELIERARLGLAEEELAVALRNVEEALKIDPTHEEAIKLRGDIQAEVARVEVDEWLRAAENAINGYAFGTARQLLRRVLDLRPQEARATELLEVVEARELAFRAARQEKDDLYRAARESWENAEFATAAARLERVLELESNAPDSSNPESTANYGSFLSLVRSAQSAIEDTRARALEHLVRGQYRQAIDLCRETASKYPGHPVPPGLACLAEAEMRRDSLSQLAAVVTAVTAETDLEKQLELLRRGIEKIPGEPLLEQWFRALRDRLAVVKTVMNRAQAREERGRFPEALEQWHLVEAINPDQAGIGDAIERLSALAGESGPALADAYASSPGAIAAAASAPPLSANGSAGGGNAAEPPVEPVGVAIAPPAAGSATTTTRSGGSWRGLPDWVRRRDANAQWALATAAAAIVVLILAAIYTAIHQSPPKPQPRAVTRVRVELRAGTAGAAIHLGPETGTGELRTALAPGTYPVESELVGFEPYSGTVEVGRDGMDQTLPALRPSPTAVYFTSDLQNARIRLDDRPDAPLEATGFHAVDIVPGAHAIAVWDAAHRWRFNFQTADATAPELQGPISAGDLVAVAVSSLGPNATVRTSAAASAATGDDVMPGSAFSGGWQFGGLQPGSHRINLKLASGERTVTIEAGARPALWIAMFSNRDVGSLEISTGIDRFRVFLEGKAYPGRIQNGSMFLANLTPGKYRVKVEADGYEALPERVVAVGKGSFKESFKLSALPQLATLSVHGAPPRTQVQIDGLPAGATDADGNFTSDQVTAGQHNIDFVNPPGYKPKRLTRIFLARETVALTAAEVHLERNPSDVTVRANAENATVEYRCGESTLRGRAPLTAACAEPQITVRISADGYTPETQTATLNPGESRTLNIELKRIAAPPPAAKKTCSLTDLGSRGWKQEQDWFASTAGATLPCNDLAGQYVWIMKLPKSKSQISITGAAGLAELVLDKKYCTLTGSPRQDLTRYEKDGQVTLAIQVDPAQIAVLVLSGRSWETLGRVAGDFHKSQIRFPAGLRLAQFTFTEK
ncbi:MAG: protein kinase [Bryobacteraceae bacterium]